jgi:hypothetical protein
VDDRPLEFLPRTTSWLPFLLVLAVSVTVVGAAIAIRGYRSTGRVPVLPLAATAVVVTGLAVAWRLRISTAPSVLVYADRVVTPAATVRMVDILHVREEVVPVTVYVQGRPTPSVRRTLRAETAGGEVVLASDDLYDVAGIAAAIRRFQSSPAGGADADPR